MDAIRKQLDVLMGANRNGDVREVNRKYYDRDVCRMFLVGLCPHELFQLTVSPRYSPSSSAFECPCSIVSVPLSLAGRSIWLVVPEISRRASQSGGWISPCALVEHLIYLLFCFSENGYGALPEGPLASAPERVSFLKLHYMFFFSLSLHCHVSLTGEQQLT